MEKIKRLSPWEIFDLWETDAGKMDFADTYDRDQLRFRVHLHDARTGFDHTSTAYMDGAFFFQMPRAEYKDWARKAVHDPQYAKSGLKAMPEVRERLDMYEHPIRYAMDFLYYDMDAEIGARNAKEIAGIDSFLTFSGIVEKYLDEDAQDVWGWVPDALIRHGDVPVVRYVERNFWRELTGFRDDENLDDFLHDIVEDFVPQAGWALRKYIVSSLSEEEVGNFCETLRKIGCTSSSTLAEITVQHVRFYRPDQIERAWLSAQNDSDIFPGAGKIIDKFEVIPHG